MFLTNNVREIFPQTKLKAVHVVFGIFSLRIMRICTNYLSYWVNIGICRSI